MNINDIVGRKSYECDIIFRIRAIEENEAILEGVFQRLIATAPLDDLVLIEDEELEKQRKRERSRLNSLLSFHKRNCRHMTGKILHIDGDEYYLNKCLELYRKLKIPAYGVSLEEVDFQKHILGLIYAVDPDVVVLTGHDSYNQKGIKELENYRNTSDYIAAVKEIRKHYSKDHIFVFAGACQSNFEALLAAGCNFASSPKRMNIDAYDPAIVAIKASTTPFNQIIDTKEIIRLVDHQKNGINGVESYGKMRLLM